MKKRILISLLAALFNTPAWADPQEYDAALAEKLGADQYGMRSYVLVTLVTGPNDATLTDKDERDKVFAGHFANMGRLADEGKLVLAGPLMESPPKRGMFVFNVTTFEEAQALVETDPAVAAGVFDYQLAKFYSSAVLVQVNQLHKRIQKTDF